MKSYIITPVALFIYLALIAYFTYPGKNPESTLGFTQYYITIAVSVVIVIALAYFLKKKAKNNEKYKDKK